jgi:hypothetical protein
VVLATARRAAAAVMRTPTAEPALQVSDFWCRLSVRLRSSEATGWGDPTPSLMEEVLGDVHGSLTDASPVGTKPARETLRAWEEGSAYALRRFDVMMAASTLPNMCAGWLEGECARGPMHTGVSVELDDTCGWDLRAWSEHVVGHLDRMEWAARPERATMCLADTGGQLRRLLLPLDLAMESVLARYDLSLLGIRQVEWPRYVRDKVRLRGGSRVNAITRVQPVPPTTMGLRRSTAHPSSETGPVGGNRVDHPPPGPRPAAPTGGHGRDAAHRGASPGDREPRRRHACGSEAHLVATCPQRQCFTCGAAGHMARVCPTGAPSSA